jgi:hypothetical protein
MLNILPKETKTIILITSFLLGLIVFKSHPLLTTLTIIFLGLNLSFSIREYLRSKKEAYAIKLYLRKQWDQEIAKKEKNKQC